jgi:hypothetical protein
MTYDFCLNPLSLPAEGAQKAFSFLNKIFVGIAAVCGDENAVLLYSNSILNNTQLAEGYTFNDYKNDLLIGTDHDLAFFVLGIEDKSPFLDKIPDKDTHEIMNYNLKIYDMPISAAESDILKYASLHNAILISLPTDRLWEKETLPVKLENIYTTIVDEVDLLNVFNDKVIHLSQEADWKGQLSNVVFSDDFIMWYNDLHEKNQLHVKNLLKRAYELKFRGTIEQTKEIKDTGDKIWEWRGGCPFCGKGRIRILYKPYQSKHLILIGFIKTSNDYTSEISIAEKALKGMQG